MAAANMKSVGLRIESIQNTMQITKTMEPAASSKLRRAREKAEAGVSYFSALQQTPINITTENTDYTSVYTRKSQGHRHCYVLITSDHGMVDGYNANLFRAFETGSREKEFVVFPLGREARDYIAQKRLECLGSEKIMIASIRVSDYYAVTRWLCALFRIGEFGHISLFYTDFVSLMKQELSSSSLLPLIDFKNEDCAICGKEEEEKKRAQNLILYELGAEEVYDAIVPGYLTGLLYSTVMSSLAGEYTARRTAMEATMDNAGEVIDKLSLYYNRARQTSTAQEITEIISGVGGSNGQAPMKEKL